MVPLMFGAPLLSLTSLFGKEHLSRAAFSMSVSLCQPYKRSPRYKQMVEYYQWKLENRYQRNLAFKGFALCHDAVVAWCIIYQLLRLAQLAEAIFAAVSR